MALLVFERVLGIEDTNLSFFFSICLYNSSQCTTHNTHPLLCFICRSLKNLMVGSAMHFPEWLSSRCAVLPSEQLDAFVKEHGMLGWGATSAKTGAAQGPASAPKRAYWHRRKTKLLKTPLFLNTTFFMLAMNSVYHLIIICRANCAIEPPICACQCEPPFPPCFRY